MCVPDEQSNAKHRRASPEQDGTAARWLAHFRPAVAGGDLPCPQMLPCPHKV